jgi:hypothetical protein
MEQIIIKKGSERENETYKININGSTGGFDYSFLMKENQPIKNTKTILKARDNILNLLRLKITHYIMNYK